MMKSATGPWNQQFPEQLAVKANCLNNE